MGRGTAGGGREHEPEQEPPCLYLKGAPLLSPIFVAYTALGTGDPTVSTHTGDGAYHMKSIRQLLKAIIHPHFNDAMKEKYRVV